MKFLKSRRFYLRFDTLFFLVWIAGLSVYCLDYSLRSESDFDQVLEVCGVFENIGQTSGRRGAGRVHFDVKPPGRVDVQIFPIWTNEYYFKPKLLPHLGDNVCVKYIRPPFLSFLQYAVSVSFDSNDVDDIEGFGEAYLDFGPYLTWLEIFVFTLVMYVFISLIVARKKV
ncbi:hypothetical protein EDC56_0599 [Sinobacterium caligoides]|uniref:Uncharacterized protein n=1 Tax=Sinobacterium caligoides TaxID=933926 RepID=A0A3N2DZ79_9GAMM|nr:hypothetical protein [Sinobacterium caligoides]ROS05077.1 hypothetical protein EDC56_0599 [Sinobacterium caligoides]